MARILFVLLLLSATGFAKCLLIDEAPQHVGSNTCVTGKVLKISQSESGSLFLDFCEEYKKCPFTVVVFPRNFRDVGDVTSLEGAEIEIYGKIKEYHGHAEIILKDAGQLHGDYSKLKSMPGKFDVDEHGNFSAGKFKSAKSPRLSHKRPSMGDRDNLDAGEEE